MLLQTHSYLVPRTRLAEHARLVGRFREVMRRLGCGTFEVFEAAGPGFSADPDAREEARFVQMMGFADEADQRRVRDAEAGDEEAQRVIAEFCRVIDFDRQQAEGTFVTGHYRAAEGDGAAVRAAAAEPDPRDTE